MPENNDTPTTETDDTGLTDTEAQQLLADALDTDTATDASDGKNWQAEAERLAQEAEKYKALARKHEGRAKQNADAANKTRTVEQRLADLQTQIEARDTAYQERSARLAMSQVRTQLAEAGIKPSDVAEILEGYDPKALLEDGEPNETAITKLAKSLAKVAGRAQPDPDQGRRGGTAPPNMNDLIRRAAGIRI